MAFQWVKRVTVPLAVAVVLMIVPVSLPADTLPFVTLQFPPYNYRSEGQVTGVSKEIVERVVRRMGHTPTFKILPWERAQEEAARGRYAGIFTFTKSVDRMKDFRYTAPLAHIKDVFFKHTDQDISWEKLSDLKGYQIGASAGYNYADVFLNAMQNETLSIQLVHSETPEILHLRKIQRGRIDLAICELRLCQFLVQKHAPDFRDVDYIERPIGPVRTFHIGIVRAWPNSKKLLRQFNKYLYQAHSKGNVDEKFRDHMSVANIEQPLEDFARDLREDLRIHHTLRTGSSDKNPVVQTENNRLITVLANREKTLGLPFSEDAVLVFWSRGGRPRLVRSGEDANEVLVSNSRVNRGTFNQGDRFTVGVVPLTDRSAADNWTIEYAPENGTSFDGGYVLIEASDVIQREMFLKAEERRLLQLLNAGDTQ